MVAAEGGGIQNIINNVFIESSYKAQFMYTYLL